MRRRGGGLLDKLDIIEFVFGKKKPGFLGVTLEKLISRKLTLAGSKINNNLGRFLILQYYCHNSNFITKHIFFYIRVLCMHVHISLFRKHTCRPRVRCVGLGRSIKKNTIKFKKVSEHKNPG